MTSTDWTLIRMGWPEPEFVLQPHMNEITIGRHETARKQCLGKHISRLHCSLLKEQREDGRVFWKIRDTSTSGTFLNGNIIGNEQPPFGLNNGDLICLGQSVSVQQAQNQRRVFLYKVRAPSSFANQGDEVDEDADTDTEIVVHSPPALPVVKEEPPSPPRVQHLPCDVKPQTNTLASASTTSGTSSAALYVAPPEHKIPRSAGVSAMETSIEVVEPPLGFNDQDDRMDEGHHDVLGPVLEPLPEPLPEPLLEPVPEILPEILPEAVPVPEAVPESVPAKKDAPHKDLNDLSKAGKGSQQCKLDEAKTDEINTFEFRCPSAVGSDKGPLKRKREKNRKKFTIDLLPLKFPGGDVTGAILDDDGSIKDWIFKTEASENKEVHSQSLLDAEQQKGPVCAGLSDISDGDLISSDGEILEPPSLPSGIEQISEDDLDIFKSSSSSFDMDLSSSDEERRGEKSKKMKRKKRKKKRRRKEKPSEKSVRKEMPHKRKRVLYSSDSDDEGVPLKKDKLNVNKALGLSTDESDESPSKSLSFSQVGEADVIVLNSDSEDEYIQASQSVKEEVEADDRLQEMDLCDDSLRKGLDEDNEDEFDVIDVSSDEALDEEQNFLFKKIKSKIKQETPDYCDIFDMDTQVLDVEPLQDEQDQPNQTPQRSPSPLRDWSPSPISSPLARSPSPPSEKSPRSPSPPPEKSPRSPTPDLPDISDESDEDEESQSLLSNEVEEPKAPLREESIKEKESEEDRPMEEEPKAPLREESIQEKEKEEDRSMEEEPTRAPRRPEPGLGTKDYLPEVPRSNRIKLIDALPMPPRKAIHRGLSMDTSMKLQEQEISRQEKEEIERELGMPESKVAKQISPPPKPVATTSFYRPPNKKSMAVIRRAPRPKPAVERSCSLADVEDVKKMRLEKLKRLAEEKSKSKEPEQKKQTALPAAKVKSSTNRSAKLLRDDDFLFKPSVKANAEKKPDHRKRHKSTENRIPKLVKARRDSCPDTSSTCPPPSSSTVQETFTNFVPPKDMVKTKTVRKKAETVEDFDGQKRIGKMRFDNMLTNVSSQDLLNTTPKTVPVLQYRGVQPEKIESKKKKKLRWRDSNLVEIRFIEKVGRGLKPESGLLVRYERGMHPKFQTMPQPQVKTKQRMDQVMRSLLNWNTKWLTEQKKAKEAPPILERFGWRLSHVTPVFANYDEYCSTFFPLMLYELWAQIFSDYCESERSPKIPFFIKGCQQTPKGTNTLIVHGLVTAEERRRELVPDEGSLVIFGLRYRVKGQNAEIRNTFGYVEWMKISPRTSDFELLPGATELVQASLVAKRPDLKYVVEMMVSVKPMERHLDNAKPSMVQLISRIKPSIRYFTAVDEAAKMPLFPSLLNPVSSNFLVPNSHDSLAEQIRCFGEVAKLNSEQRHIVVDVAKMSLTNPGEPRAALVQGPPGTGKSTTIAATVLQILFKAAPGRKPRILVTAPSNAAVDQALRKILALGEQLPKDQRFTVVRIGKARVIHPDVQPRQLEALVEGSVVKKIRESSNLKSVEMEVTQRQQKINALGEAMEMEQDEAKQKMYTRELRQETEYRNRAQKMLRGSRKDMDKFRRLAFEEILDKADVIGTTLNSSMNGQMERFFLGDPSKRRTHRPFSICIIDEATQCVEPEALIPLRLGYTKLVMVGDPKQLPATVVSQEAKDMSYNHSMFNRLFGKFETPGHSRVVMKLRTQYRMHSDIVKWPNFYFYGDELMNGNQNRVCGLRPLVLFNYRLSEESYRAGMIWNEQEAKMVAKLAKEVRARVNSDKTIGVITFYSKQQNVISLELQNEGVPIQGLSNKPSDRPGVIVKSVDGFQGSECDVIIVSCVRSTRKIGFVAEEERLNVALTRAKFALYVVGNFHTLQKNAMWSSFIHHAEKRNLVEEVKNNAKFEELIRVKRAEK